MIVSVRCVERWYSMSSGMTISGVSGVTQQDAASTLGKTVGLATATAAGSLISNIAVDSFSLSSPGYRWAVLKNMLKDGECWKHWGTKAGIAAAVIGGGYLLYKGIANMFSNKG